MLKPDVRLLQQDEAPGPEPVLPDDGRDDEEDGDTHQEDHGPQGRPLHAFIHSFTHALIHQCIIHLPYHFKLAAIKVICCHFLYQRIWFPSLFPEI